MTQFLDMNDDCIDHVLTWLKCSDSESIETVVAISETCKRLQTLTTRFINHTSYSCSVTSDDDENRVKRTIAKIGIHLVELNVNIAKGYTALKPVFFKRLPDKCPMLKKLDIVSCLSPNVTFDGVQMLQHLEHLTVRCYEYVDDVDKVLVTRLANQSKELKSLRVIGAEWDYQTVVDFIHKAEKLDCLNFEIEYIQKHLEYEISNTFMDEFRYLQITDLSELIYFLEFRDLLKTIFY